jgi:site-specific recombinase XerD
VSAVTIDHAPLDAGRPGWAVITRQQPQLADTATRYLDQIAVSLRPRSVEAADNTLRTFITFLADEHSDLAGFADVRRAHIEDFKEWLAQRRTTRGVVSANTIRQRLGMLRTFFDRIIEWDWTDAPPRTPIFGVDLPIVDDPLPKFLDDATAARLLNTARAADPLTRIVVEVLAHTGVRVGELCDLERDAVIEMGKAWWLRVPVGKLHNDRYVPLLPSLVELLAQWLASTTDHGTGLLFTKDGHGLNRHQVTRIVNRVAAAAGVGHVHPHQLRHTLATQAINRGMRLEAVAALLGHRSLRMTMTYARIANKTVSDEYHAATAKVEALYRSDLETPAMRELASEHRRMLANGWCTRPREMDCAFESICEGCGFFATTVEFKPILERQRDHAATHDQPARETRYAKLLDDLEGAAG